MNQHTFVVQPCNNTFLRFFLVDDEEDSDDDYSGKDFDRESPRDDMDVHMNVSGFDVESMRNARKCAFSKFKNKRRTYIPC